MEQSFSKELEAAEIVKIDQKIFALIQNIHILMVEFSYNRVCLIDEGVTKVCLDTLEKWVQAYASRVRNFRENVLDKSDPKTYVNIR